MEVFTSISLLQVLNKSDLCEIEEEKKKDLLTKSCDICGNLIVDTSPGRFRKKSVEGVSGPRFVFTRQRSYPKRTLSIFHRRNYRDCVKFYVENKKIFPLSTGIKQSKMPMSYELQGVSLAGQSMDTQCFLDVKDDKFSGSLQKDKNKDFALFKDKQFCAKRETCGHFGSFPVISFSHLVGGFVGSKSQIRSVNRETCQIWDVIFRQLAETACQTPSMQSQYYNIGKTFSQNLLNSICQESRSALDGIASYLISKGCEFLQEQEMIHSMTVSEFKGKDVTLESSIAQYCKEVTNCCCEPHPMDSPDHFIAAESVFDLESSVVNNPKQSYAEVAKSVIYKSENTNSNQTNLSSGRNRISTRRVKEIKGKSKVATSSDPSKLDDASNSEDIVKNSVKQLKKMDKSYQYKERCTSGTSRPDLQTTKTIFYNKFPIFCSSSQHPKRVTQKFKFSYVPSREEMGNWRERRENSESIWQHNPQNFKGRGQYKPLNMVYPAFSRKKNSCGSKAQDITDRENFSKHQRCDESSNKATIDVLGVSQCGKRLKQLPKVVRTKARETQDRKRDCDRKATRPFGLHTNMANTCRNWRCKHKGAFCEAFHCDNYTSAGNNIGKTVPLTCIPEPYIGGSPNAVCSNKDSLRIENLQNPSHSKEQIVPLPIVPDATSSIECISVSSSCEDMHDISENRKRFLSECSVDSDDSFVVFFESECVQEASPEDCGSRQLFRYPSIEVDISDGWSDEDDDDSSSCSGDNGDASDDQDEVDFVFFPPPLSVPGLSFDCSDKLVSPLPDRLKDINETWRKDNASVPGDEKSSTKVHFPTCQELVTVHPMVKWDFAYRAARCGPWEEMARDRARFQARVDRLEPILSPVLTPEHRQKARLRMISSAIS